MFSLLLLLLLKINTNLYHCLDEDEDSELLDFFSFIALLMRPYLCPMVERGFFSTPGIGSPTTKIYKKSKFN